MFQVIVHLYNVELLLDQSTVVDSQNKKDRMFGLLRAAVVRLSE